MLRSSNRSKFVLILSSMTHLRSLSSCAATVKSTAATSTVTNEVYIALGSNVQDRSGAIHHAFRKLCELGKMKQTSFLYETLPMYHENQAKFLNAACILETHLAPEDLLRSLQSIERQVGRQTTFRNGPRVVDIDILFFNSLTMNDTELQIPHPRIAERAFVLRPLCDMNPQLIHPLLKCSVQQLYDALDDDASKTALVRLIPCGSLETYSGMEYTASHVLPHVDRRPFLRLHSASNSDGRANVPIIFGILNVTPDSFSDGGQFDQDIERAVQQVQRLVKDGAEVIDIGGESTRPGAEEVEIGEEINRVVPVIRAIRQANIRCVISIDTRKAAVARAAVLAGAHIVNDVSGGRHDSLMLPTVAELMVPYVMMHMRGDPKTMTSKLHTTYRSTSSDDTRDAVRKQQLQLQQQQIGTGEGFTANDKTIYRGDGFDTMYSPVGAAASYGDVLVDVISRELSEQLELANSMIPRWLQIVDPGIGFAKGYEENMALLQPRILRKLKSSLGDRPLLIGMSRKRFLTQILQDTAPPVSSSSSNLVWPISSSSGSFNTRGDIADSSDSGEGIEGTESSDDSVAPPPREITLLERDTATAGACCAAMLGGAEMLRVHDVATTRNVCATFAQFL